MSTTFQRNSILFVLVLIAAISRIIPHPLNFTPLAAIGMFGAAYFTNKKYAYIVPLVAMLLSDVILNNTLYASMHSGFTVFYKDWYWVYATVLFITLVSTKIFAKVNFTRVIGGALLSALIFFVVTNFSSWLHNDMYTKDIKGITNCYLAAIPFFKGTLLGNLFYSVVLFGMFEFITRQFPSLKLQHAKSM